MGKNAEGGPGWVGLPVIATAHRLLYRDDQCDECRHTRQGPSRAPQAEEVAGVGGA